MYWFKTTNYTVLLLCMVLMYGCKPEARQSNGTLKYFDITGYFNAETLRLTALNKPVTKTVAYNSVPETKIVFIKNWQRELALFTSSDINKPAWKSSYTVQKYSDSVVYRAIDTNLHTRQIIIVTKANKVNSVSISNFTKNMLYQTKEELKYYPDSLYYIEKHQAVKLLGTNNYGIIGRFK